MGRISLRQAAQWCGGWVDSKYEDISFFGASNDSRKIQPGQLFVALQGQRDGHDFIPKALENGASAVLCSHCHGDFPAIIVDDPRLALGAIAREERKRIGMQVVGVTGSVGKSTTKEMIACVLSSRYHVEKTPVNHNNDIGMPMAILSMPEDTEVAVLEMGMNHFREIAYLASIALPDVAVIINIGTMHIEHLGSQEGILKAKLEILEGMRPEGCVILNGDDRLLWNVQKNRQNVTYFGVQNPHCQILGHQVVENDGSVGFTVELEDDRFDVLLQLEGKHFVHDALAAVSVGLALEIPAEMIAQSLKYFENMDGRQEIREYGGITVIQDYYNAGPESMAAALNVLGNRTGRKIAVLGDMLELGMCAAAEHYKVGRIAAEKADVVFAYGPNGCRVVSGARTGGMVQSHSRHFEDKDELADVLKHTAKPGDVILIKGSHGMHMEEILRAFLKEET